MTSSTWGCSALCSRYYHVHPTREIAPLVTGVGSLDCEIYSRAMFNLARDSAESIFSKDSSIVEKYASTVYAPLFLIGAGVFKGLGAIASLSDKGLSSPVYLAHLNVLLIKGSLEEQQKEEEKITPEIEHLKNVVQLVDPLITNLENASTQSKEALPIIKELSERYHSHQNTIRKAIELLKFVQTFLNSKKRPLANLELALKRIIAIEQRNKQLDALASKVTDLKQKTKKMKEELRTYIPKLEAISQVEKDQYESLEKDAEALQLIHDIKMKVVKHELFEYPLLVK